MGLDESEAKHLVETPKHEVTLSDFRIGKYEVTQDLWEAVMGDNSSISKGD
ncbi:MAG: SUMF1/EgtB/PvdO family nonheme iron enzyme [Bacteroidales bacterium]|nr:SUMF1/EgtB/PvdO family nonheme iron enzyme [Bacteroidales bacterium]